MEDDDDTMVKMKLWTCFTNKNICSLLPDTLMLILNNGSYSKNIIDQSNDNP